MKNRKPAGNVSGDSAQRSAETYARRKCRIGPTLSEWWMEPLESRLHLNGGSREAVPPLIPAAIGSQATAAAINPHSPRTIVSPKGTRASAVGAAPLSLIPDPKKHVIISPNPASPGEGGIVTIRAITNDLGPLSGDRLLVAWGDGRLSDLADDGASFGTYDTRDPLTKGITVTHTYLRGGTYDPYLNSTNDNGDSAFAQFGFPETLFLPGAIPTITSPAQLLSLSGTTAHLHVAGIASDSSDAVYDWQIIGQPKNALPAEFVAPDYNTTASPTVQFTQAGIYNFRVSIAAKYGSLYATAFLKVRVDQRPSSTHRWSTTRLPHVSGDLASATPLFSRGPMEPPPSIPVPPDVSRPQHCHLRSPAQAA